MKKGKEFIFPENVNKEFGVWKDYTLKDILTVILPTILVGLVFIVITPNVLWFAFLKWALFFIVLTVVLAIITVKPIKSRPNITLRRHFTMKREYDKNQKLFYLKPTKTRREL